MKNEIINDCDVINDFLPLYIEDMVSESSRQLVLNHLENCSDCKMLEKTMRIQPNLSPITTNLINTENSLQTFRKKMTRYSALLFCLGAFATIWIIMLIWGLYFLRPDDAMFYSLLTFYFALPITSLICCVIIGKKDTRLKYFMPFIFGCANMLLPFIKYHYPPSIDSIYTTIIPAVIGLLIGITIRHFKKN